MLQEGSGSSGRILATAVIGGVAVLGIWALSGLWIYAEFNDSASRGTFGDMFGAVNALFSGLAFLGLIVAILLQYQELKEQRREIRESRIAQQASAVALASQLERTDFRNLLEALTALIHAQERIVDSLQASTSVRARERYDRARERLTWLESEREAAVEKELLRLDITES